jgi:hypothetical protein
VYRSVPVLASHTHIVLSPEPETMERPSGEKATEVTVSVWPSKMRPCKIDIQPWDLGDLRQGIPTLLAVCPSHNGHIGIVTTAL